MEPAFDQVERKIPPFYGGTVWQRWAEPVSGMDIYRDPFCKDFYSFQNLVLAGTGSDRCDLLQDVFEKYQPAVSGESEVPKP